MNQSEGTETPNLKVELLLLLHTLLWGGLSGSPAAGDQCKSNVRIEDKFSLAQISDVEAVQMGSLLHHSPVEGVSLGFQ